MFTIDELYDCSTQKWFSEGYKHFANILLLSRLGLQIRRRPDTLTVSHLSRYSEAVLASATSWESNAKARKLCERAADIEIALAILHVDPVETRCNLLRGAILYELAGLPATAASSIKSDLGSISQKAFFTRDRTSVWGLLRNADDHSVSQLVSSIEGENLAFDAMDEILEAFGRSLQRSNDGLYAAGLHAHRNLTDFFGRFSTPINCNLHEALLKAIDARRQSSALELLTKTELTREVLTKLSIPSELWPVQKLALSEGLLNPQIKSFGIAAPTGTGKTALTRILLADFFQKNPGKTAFYISPSRALTSQIAKDLHASLDGIGISVMALGASLNIATDIALQRNNADVIVFTPEKADLLLRVQPEAIEQAGLVIVDEAHHIEQGTRGMLLEFYLWRLRSLLPSSTRIVQLSAVAPNIGELVGWLGTASESAHTKLDWRSGRLRLGQFERLSDGAGVIQFEEGAPCEIFAPTECSADSEEGLAQLALKLSKKGIVLVLTTSTKKAEQLAVAIAKALAIAEPKDPSVAERVDARVERELYPTCILRELYKRRVAYHHARLPPRVRAALEQAISAKEIDIICATTTLAEGVNFPFSTVIVESLIGKGFELSPRSLWNIAGRAGRFGVDSEGHCILFRPNSWKHRLKDNTLESYLTSRMDGIPPVRSALAKGLAELKEAVDKRELQLSSLSSIILDFEIGGKKSERTKRIRGLLNVMRVGYAHALVTKVITTKENESPEFQNKNLLASQQMSPELRDFSIKVSKQQRGVIAEAAKKDSHLLEIAARIGWSLESQTALYEWVQGCHDWQLEQFGNLVRGGRITSFDRLGYLIGPISTRMSEFEGGTLGGTTSYIAINWLRGFPLTAIRNSDQKKQAIEYSDLVSMIYARVQYLLPWALFGVHELVQLEARHRSLKVGSGISDLSALASEGVSSFDALNLVLRLDLERVDANRLATAYYPWRNEIDIFGWLKNRPWAAIAGWVQAPDNRRLDPDLKTTWEKLKEQSTA